MADEFDRQAAKIETDWRLAHTDWGYDEIPKIEALRNAVAAALRQAAAEPHGTCSCPACDGEGTAVVSDDDCGIETACCDKCEGKGWIAALRQAARPICKDCTDLFGEETPCVVPYDPPPKAAQPAGRVEALKAALDRLLRAHTAENVAFGMAVLTDPGPPHQSAAPPASGAVDAASTCRGGPGGSPILGCEGGRKPVIGCGCRPGAADDGEIGR